MHAAFNTIQEFHSDPEPSTRERAKAWALRSLDLAFKVSIIGAFATFTTCGSLIAMMRMIGPMDLNIHVEI